MRIFDENTIKKPPVFVFSDSLAALGIVKKATILVCIDRLESRSWTIDGYKRVVRYSRDQLAVIDRYERDTCNLWPRLMRQFSLRIFSSPAARLFDQSINTGSGSFPRSLLSEPDLNFLCLDMMC